MRCNLQLVFWAGKINGKRNKKPDYLPWRKHSDYAAWLSTMGLQANTLPSASTILKKYPTIER